MFKNFGVGKAGVDASGRTGRCRGCLTVGGGVGGGRLRNRGGSCTEAVGGTRGGLEGDVVFVRELGTDAETVGFEGGLGIGLRGTC